MEIKFLEHKFALLALADSDNANDVEETNPIIGLTESKVCENVFEKVVVGTKAEIMESKSVVCALTPDNIACRQVLSKELPTYSGRPEEWAIFYSSFEHSTQLCMYSGAENLIRLQRALKGDALKSVGNMLLIPSSVPEVMQMLKQLYGRPELIIDSLIKKVKNRHQGQIDLKLCWASRFLSNNFSQQ